MPNLLDKKQAKAEYDKVYKLRNKERISARMKQYYLELTDEAKAKREEYRRQNREKHKAYIISYKAVKGQQVKQTIRDWYYANKERKSIKAKEWKQKNRGAVNAIAAKRRAVKLNATPKWANIKTIKEFYKNCPEGYHVDHIIPLQGKNVCGLHVLENLQYLPIRDNLSKGNRYEFARYN